MSDQIDGAREIGDRRPISLTCSRPSVRKTRQNGVGSERLSNLWGERENSPMRSITRSSFAVPRLQVSATLPNSRPAIRKYALPAGLTRLSVGRQAKSQFSAVPVRYPVGRRFNSSPTTKKAHRRRMAPSVCLLACAPIRLSSPGYSEEA